MAAMPQQQRVERRGVRKLRDQAGFRARAVAIQESLKIVVRKNFVRHENWLRIGLA
jgi:hypothetical protein